MSIKERGVYYYDGSNWFLIKEWLKYDLQYTSNPNKVNWGAYSVDRITLPEEVDANKVAGQIIFFDTEDFSKHTNDEKEIKKHTLIVCLDLDLNASNVEEIKNKISALDGVKTIIHHR